MSQSSSEEKSLPASHKKLSDARKKGQVPHSRDLVSVITLVAGILYLAIEGPVVMELLRTILVEPITLTAKPFSEAYTIMPTLLALAARIVLPLILIVVLASIIANVAFMRGIPLSVHPLIPTPDKINPVSGFQRLFSLRNVIEFAKSIVKTCVLLGVIGALIIGALRAVLVAPQCGQDCIGLVLIATLKPVLIGIVAVLLVFALLDMVLQRWLFLRDQRMTLTEMKRERKEQDGDPHIRSALRSQQRAMAQGGRPDAATLYLTDGTVTVGVRYAPDEGTPVPTLVSKKWRARDKGKIPIELEPDLTRRLLDAGQVGETVPDHCFDSIARVLVRLKLL